MEEEQRRKEAICRRLSKERISHICHDLEVSKKWFNKWWQRYKTGDENWFKDQSRAPKQVPKKLDKKMEQLIVSVRERLENSKFAQIGVSSIAWQIKKLGHAPPPSWTINRVLKRNGCIPLQAEKKAKKSDNTYSYFTKSFYPGDIHQADLVGTRYIQTSLNQVFYCSLSSCLLVNCEKIHE